MLCASVCSQSGSRYPLFSITSENGLPTTSARSFFRQLSRIAFRRVAADLSRASYASVSCGFAAIIAFAATAVFATKLLPKMVLQDQGNLVVCVRNENDLLSRRVFGEGTHLVLDVFA